MIRLLKIVGLVLGILSVPLLPLAQAVAPAATTPATTATAGLLSQTLVWGLMLMAGLLIIILGLMLLMLAVLVDYFLRQKFGSGLFPKFSAIEWPTFLSWSKITGLRASKSAGAHTMDQPLGHSYDGIDELDNAPPPIFNYILIGSIIHAIGYLLVFHVFQAAPLQKEEYEMAVAKANVEKAEREKLAKDQVDETTVTLLTAQADIDAGKGIFTTNCVVCHGTDGAGLVGPNLTDGYWIGGNNVKDVFRTIKKGGRPGKGMIAWESQLTPSQMAQVASYVLQSFPGTQPANPKAPDGDLYTPASKTPAPTDSTKTDSSAVALK